MSRIVAGPGMSSGGAARPPYDRVALAAIGVTSVLALTLLAVLLLGHEPRPDGGIDVSALPALNALLNGMSASLLTAGWICIRRRRVRAHQACMLGAFGVSLVFLLSYVIYHYFAGSRPFTGPGWIRPVYFALLVSHIVLAAAIVPLALTTIYRGLTWQLGRHVRIARWTLPLWLYVSVTGVVIYLLLYRL
jgi:putative membrane protein